jgi:glycosyltransferase involved in cell wall biosynthesis
MSIASPADTSPCPASHLQRRPAALPPEVSRDMPTQVLAESLAQAPSRAATAGDASKRPTIRVLHLINGEHYAGAERVQDLLAMRLGELGVEVGFVCLKHGHFAALRRSQHVPLSALPMRHRLDLGCARQIARLVRHEGFDLIHSHTPRTALIGRLAARRAGVPLVHHVHGQTATEVRRGWWARLTARAENWALRRAAAIIAVSATAQRYLVEQGFSPQQVCVVPNGIVVQGPLPPRPAPRAPWRLGLIGLLRPRKGLEVLLHAMAHLRAAGHDVRLRAVGTFETESYGQQVRKLAHELGVESSIVWRGFQRDVAAELAEMDVMAFPSVLPEGMPMVVLEAMAAGVPIVASRVAGVTDVLRDTHDAVLVQPGDAAALATGIARVLGQEPLWHRLRASAWQRQQEAFSDVQMATAVAGVYRRVLADRSAGSP